MSEDPPPLRASDAEREASIARLREAAGEGRLSFEELADRIEAAAGSATRGELERLTADLPAERVPTGPPAVVAPVAQRSVFGDVKRSGRWRVPATGAWKTVFGDIVLDVREAIVGEPRVAVEARTVFGDIELLVPEGVTVEIGASTMFGDIRQSAGADASPGAPVIVLTGGTVFGDVKVRSQRTRERLVERLRRGA